MELISTGSEARPGGLRGDSAPGGITGSSFRPDALAGAAPALAVQTNNPMSHMDDNKQVAGTTTVRSVVLAGLRKAVLSAVAIATVFTAGRFEIPAASGAAANPSFRWVAKSSTLEFSRVGGGSVPSSELQWWHYQVLLNNPDLERLLRYLNTDKGWKIGPELPKDFKYTASRKNLDRMIKAASASGFGVNSTVRVRENGSQVGSRNTSRYVFELMGTRNAGKPYTAIVECGRDLNSGHYWTMVAVLEGKNGNILNIHEYAVEGGKVYRTSNKKGETFLLRSVHLGGGLTQGAFAKVTLPAMQKASGLFQKSRQFLVSDPNAAVHELAAASMTVDVAADQGWWNEIKNKLLEKLKELGEKLAKKLLEMLESYIKDHYQEILKVIGAVFGGVLDSILGSIGDLFDWLSGLF